MGDYLEIPQGEAPGTADDTAQAALGINLFANRQCGRYLAIADAATASATVCSRQYPFRVGVHFDSEEQCTNAIETTANCEWDIMANTMPGGGIGFKLYFWQQSC